MSLSMWHLSLLEVASEVEELPMHFGACRDMPEASPGQTYKRPRHPVEETICDTIR